jgi:hypothetical protein
VEQAYPAHLFRIGGSPEAIQIATVGYQRFGHAASEAAQRITGIETAQFVGPEGDRFRTKLNSDLPPHLRVTGQAFTKVASALAEFASKLADLQATMRPVAEQAPRAWQRLQAAKAAVADAPAADQAHDAAQQQGQHAAPNAAASHQPPPPAVPAAAYRVATPGGQGALSAAQQEWDALVHKATNLRSEMAAASDRCSKAIEAAKAMRFKSPPGEFDLVGQAEDFVREHKDTLKSVSGALKIASAVVTAVGLALQAIPVVGNAVGGVLLVAGGVMGAAAVGIDLAVYSATGDGNLTSIVVDAALTVVPVGRLAKLGKSAFSMAKDWSFLARGTSHVTEPAIHAASANPRMAKWFLRDQHPWMNGENAINAPRFHGEVPGYTENCSNNVITVEHRLNGVEVSTAPLQDPRWPEPAALGDSSLRFKDVSSYDEIIKDMHARGEGARGVVYINRPGNPALFLQPSAHVFNVVHGPHGVEFLDGQSGTLADLEQNINRIGYMPYR